MQQRFSYHKTVAPMLWMMVALATGEMLLVHLFLTLRWPVVGWPLLLLSAASVVWLIVWIRSFRRYPHLLSDGELKLRTGSLRVLAVPVSAIACVSTNWLSGEHKGQGATNVVPLAYPNRMLCLKAPIKTRKGSSSRIAFRIDDPVSFDAAMATLGIPVH